jgi:protein-arginine kinase activator protein McsA
MAQVTNIVCDGCGEAPAKVYVIILPPRDTRQVDLCEACSAPLVALHRRGRKHAITMPSKRFVKTEVETV